MWLLFALSGPVAWAISTHIDKYLVDKYFKDHSTAILMVFTALLSAVALPVMYLFDPDVLAIPLVAKAVMTLSGVLYMGAMLFYLQAIQNEEASVVAPLFQATTLFTFLFGWLILGELPTLTQSAGIIIIILAAGILAFANGISKDKIKLKLVLIMIGCTAALAFSSVIFKVFAIAEDSFWPVTFWNFVGEALFGIGLLMVPGHYTQFKKLFKKHPGAVIGINATNELINVGGGLGVRYASLLAPVAVVSAISSTTTVFVFVFGILITIFLPRFGEESITKRDIFTKGVAAVLVVVGVVLANAQ